MSEMSGPPIPKRGKSPRKPRFAPSLPFLVKYRKLAERSRGMSQAELGLKSGYSQGMISQWENGESDVPVTAVYKLAAALSITPEQLMFRNPDDGEHIAEVWDRIAEGDRPQALRILKTFISEPEPGQRKKEQ
jgi:transcriptional regulator with XRE-family HTH domain